MLPIGGDLLWYSLTMGERAPEGGRFGAEQGRVDEEARGRVPSAVVLLPPTPER